jgi:Ca2+-binding RTX toxin-like protein
MNLRGNDVANDLLGSPFADLLDGQGGIDTLRGGAGADRYAFGLGSGVDTIVENDGTANVVDVVQFGAGVLQSQLAFARASNNLEVSIAGTSDRLIVKDWYLGTQHRIEEFRFADGSVTAASQVQALGDAMAAFGAPSSQVASNGSLMGGDAFNSRIAMWRGTDLVAAG